MVREPNLWVRGFRYNLPELASNQRILCNSKWWTIPKVALLLKLSTQLFKQRIDFCIAHDITDSVLFSYSWTTFSSCLLLLCYNVSHKIWMLLIIRHNKGASEKSRCSWLLINNMSLPLFLFVIAVVGSTNLSVTISTVALIAGSMAMLVNAW